MNRFKRVANIITAICIACACICMFVSCGPEKQEADFMIYYSNSSNDDVVYNNFNLPGKENMSAEDVAGILTDKLFAEDLEDGIHYSPLPKDVAFNSLKIKDGTAVLDFDSNFYRMTNVQELILKASVVLTLIQADGIQGIEFTVDGKPALDRNGNEIGALNEKQYIDILLSGEGMLRQETALVIYFANETATALVPSTYKFTIDNKNQSLEEYIVNKLIEGPGGEMTPVLDPEVELISIMTSERTCYVNFSSYFLEQNQAVSDELMIYSIVNSLCRLPYVNNVQFLVEGDANIILHRTFDLSKPIKRHSEYIEEKNN